jgi:hypothetical protein
MSSIDVCNKYTIVDTTLRKLGPRADRPAAADDCLRNVSVRRALDFKAFASPSSTRATTPKLAQRRPVTPWHDRPRASRSVLSVNRSRVHDAPPSFSCWRDEGPCSLSRRSRVLGLGLTMRARRLVLATQHPAFAVRSMVSHRGKANHASRMRLRTVSRQKIAPGPRRVRDEDLRPFERRAPTRFVSSTSLSSTVRGQSAWIRPAADLRPETHCVHVPPRRGDASSNGSRCFLSSDSDRACGTNPAALTSGAPPSSCEPCCVHVRLFCLSIRSEPL